jgi:hypothetical protein
MKKILLCFVIIGLPISAWGRSIGLSSFFFADQGGGFETQTTFMDKKMGASLPMSYSGGGFSAFFDIQFLEASIGFLFGNGYNTELFVSSPIIEVERIGGELNFAAVKFGLMGKYPFENRRLAHYPLLGIEYNVVFFAEIDDEKIDKLSAWNQLWFKFGWGLDYHFSQTSPWYFRGGLLYGFRLPTKMEKDFAAGTKKQMEQSFYENFGTVPAISSRILPGHGITLKIAVGYKF